MVIGAAGGNPSDRVAVGEPEGAVRPRDDPPRAVDAGVLEVRDSAAGRDAPDRIAGPVGEPESAVRPRRDLVRPANARVPEARNLAAGRNAPDRIAVGEPESAVRPYGDPPRLVDAHMREARNLAAGRDPPDRVVPRVGEPERTVRPCDDPQGVRHQRNETRYRHLRLRRNNHLRRTPRLLRLRARPACEQRDTREQPNRYR